MDYFLNYIVKNNLIKSDEKEIYRYGIVSLTLNLITIFSIIITSIFFKKLSFSILFILSFVPIRMTLGGFHCKTPLNCILSFNLIYLFHLFFITHMPDFYTLFCIPLIILLMILTPYININKIHLSNKKTNIKKNIILLINLIVFLFLNNIILKQSIFTSILINFELYLFAKINDRIKNIHLYFNI